MKYIRSIAFLVVLAGIGFAHPALAVVADATNLFTITKTGFVLNRATNTFDTTVTIKNTSPFTVGAPVQLVVSGLPAGVTLANAAGTTSQGNPYVSVNVPGNAIISNAIVTPIILKIRNPLRLGLAPVIKLSGDIPEVATWPRFSAPAQGVAFSYPTFDQPSQIQTQTGTDGSLGIGVLTTTPEPLVQYIVGVIPNQARLTLLQWFSRNVDLSGAIVAGGGYQQRTLPNGIQVLIITGEVPVPHIDCCGPLQDMYAISPSKATIVTVTTGHEHDFGAIGANPAEIDSLYLAMLASMSAP